MHISSFILRVMLSAGIVLSGRSGLYHDINLFYGFLSFVSLEQKIDSTFSLPSLLVSYITERRNLMLICFSVVIGLYYYGVVLSTDFG